MTLSQLPTIEIVEGPDAGSSIEVGPQGLVIGREVGVDLLIASSAVSRKHARLYWQNAQIFLDDLGSSNGTFLNGQRISSPQRLKDGDRFSLGQSITLSFRQPASAATTTLDGAPPPDAGVAATRLDSLPQITGVGATVVGESALPGITIPPQLVITLAGAAPQVYALTRDRYTIGRSSDNDIQLASAIVSGRHALLEKSRQGYQITVLPAASNPIIYQGQPIQGVQELHDGDLLRIGSQDPSLMVTIIYQAPAEETERAFTRQVAFGESDILQIGRDPSNDVVLDAPTISRYHALVERVGQRYRLRDLQSANGTYVNDEPVKGDFWLNAGDSIRVGPYRFVLGADQLTAYDETGGLRLEALSLNKWVRKDLNLLKDLSLVFKPKEFIVVVGQSGGGKSTLVDAIAGYRPATNGTVLVNDVDAYRYFDSVRDLIGFVPQKDIVHQELTATQELDYAAQLRMPPDTTPAERMQRVNEVLEELDLTHRKDVPISGLSGGQLKRVSIGVELLTRPGLFFLDEPTSGLDPGTETALMHLMRRLADQGRTIILITHATKNVMLADKVVFLARGGYLAWFGPPDEALAYFDQFRSERDRRARPMEFDEIYAILDNSSLGSAAEWHERFRQLPAYQTYIVDALHEHGHALPINGAASQSAAAGRPAPVRTPAPAKSIKRTSSFRQFRILSARNIKILIRDRASLILMLAAAPLVGMLDVVLSLTLGRQLFDYNEGVMASAITSMFMPLMYAVLVGALSQMREFVKESEIYKRERLVNLRVLPYVLSKVWVALLLAIYQAFCYTLIHSLSFNLPGGFEGVALFFLTMFLIVFAGMMMGLLGSAVAPNANAAPLLVILLVVPQLVLSGALIPLPGPLTSITATRWAFESLVSVSGAGSDVAADACWEMSEEQRDELDLDEKAALGCQCMGINALRQESCEFPGIGEYYDPAIDQPEPIEPADIGDPPGEPNLPPAPEAPGELGPAPVAPADLRDTAAVGQFMLDMQAFLTTIEDTQTQFKTDLDAYLAEAELAQDQFKADMDAFQDKAEVFEDEMRTYQEDRATWEVDRNAAVGKAEGLIKTFYDDFSWTFVDKEDSSAYWGKLARAWGIMIMMQLLAFGGIMILMSRKK